MKRFLALLLFAACSKPAPPAPPAKPALPAQLSVAAAQSLIENAPELGDYQFTNASFTIAQKKSAMNPLMLEGAKKLAAAKWIRIEGDRVELTPKAQADKRFLVRSNGFIDLVPLAKKELIAVTAVRQDAADFTWKWVPNELGATLGQPPAGEQKATAKLMWDGSSWTVLGMSSS